ncbi:hypothetical protein E1211_14585 [Micromonospora sp. 15K316]|uniref:hypothetical protein n=1 Tax=Micromonospora sp. 15K316 TaxID=2530376 RepID=UPI0010441BB0|nr:hypothetical protein [Micromonospora sp. 15K316]TDC36059.1 hypothetical protein E1211_14585 [Micromonospora sp. 15K316]
MVRAALLDAGFQVDTIADPSELHEVFYGFDQDMTEFEVHRDDQAVRLQLVRFARTNNPVVLDIGPVRHLDDVIGTRSPPMITRAQPRDYIDVAAALNRYTRHGLITLGRRAHPDLTDDEIHNAIRRLDRLPDTVFALYRLSPTQIQTLRGVRGPGSVNPAVGAGPGGEPGTDPWNGAPGNGRAGRVNGR